MIETKRINMGCALASLLDRVERSEFISEMELKRSKPKVSE
jgi:hypothetical protein